MKPLNPKIKKYDYSTGNPFWLLSCTLPDGGRYRRKHSTEETAKQDRMRLIREYHGGGLKADEIQVAEAALLKLRRTSNPDAQGKDLLTIVDWFIKHYRDTRHELYLDEYVEDFINRKKKRRSVKTIQEILYYLNAFKEVFGSRKPSEIEWKELDRYLAVNNHVFHRYKVLNHFFGWLANEAKDISKLENPPISINPLSHIERPKQKRSRPEICTVPEVKNLIKKAIEKNCAPWFVWGFFTGMRPEAEMKQFWKNSEYGWKFVDLVDRKIIVSEEIEKTGKRTREIKIQDNLMAWIKFFASHPKDFPMLPTNLKRKFRAVKQEILLDKKAKENDIMRHTFISNLSKIEPIGEVCYQCATSLSMIRRHYKVLITDNKRVEEFFGISPGDFGLS